MDAPRIALFGATGFIGSATLAALTSAGADCTAVARRPGSVTSSVQRVAGADLTDPASLDAALSGADVIVHAVSYTGTDPEQADAVNRAGTENLVAAAHSRCVPLIYVSTIGVYGSGPHHGIVEGTLDPQPVSVLSASRFAAERSVLQHGGTVIRTGFVHGPGDRWFTPGLVYILARLGAWVDEGRSVLSLIDVGDLGRLLAALAMQVPPLVPGGVVLHAAHPEPRTVREIATELAAGGTFTLPQGNLTFAEALSRAPELGLSERNIDLAGHDHHYDSTRIWEQTGLDIPPVRPLPAF
ncbi:MAG: NAD(P)-dependent oxidoreductase [Rhodococcus sp. (in: high G+C Gram-positive bacteria)]|uniref:NAD-dependent epimerase/dehydratase family protein n=1 Tax=Rhodococcus sp. TaxID=1831 RepID=UPI003BB5FAA3